MWITVIQRTGYGEVISYSETSNLKRRFLTDKDSNKVRIIQVLDITRVSNNAAGHIQLSRLSWLIYWDMETSSHDFLSPIMTYITVLTVYFLLPLTKYSNVSRQKPFSLSIVHHILHCYNGRSI